MTELPDEEDEYGDIERGDGTEDEETTAPEDELEFDPASIDVQTRNPTVSLLLSRLRRGVLDLDADFQRKAGLWTDERQSQLIESLLLRFPLPTLYAAETSDEGWTIVDGIQRLTAIARFVAPGTLPVPPGAKKTVPLRLTGLQYLRKLEGKSYGELSGGDQTRIDETELVVHLIRSGTPEPVKFNIFARINTGGLPLTSQELRHALIPGRSRDLLRELAGEEEFLEATQRSIRPDRMADREMILRFLAFRMVKLDEYKYQDLDAFLRHSMLQINLLPEDEISRLTADLRRSMVAARSVFGDHAFRKVFEEGQTRRSPINKALFEAVSVNLAALTSDQLILLQERRAEAMVAMVELMKVDEPFMSSISFATGSRMRVKRRFEGIQMMLRGVLE